jgi:hypothetical protein
MFKNRWVGVCALLSLTACGGESRQEGDSDDSTSQELAPAGSNATFVSTTMKSSWYPGERGQISVTMQNTGSLGATDYWTNPLFALTSLDGQWDWSFVRVGNTVQTGNSYVFTFMVAAPNAPGSYLFAAGMQQLGHGNFGDVVTVPVVVDASSPRPRGCTFLTGSSTLPMAMTPDENRVVIVTVQNTGTVAWSSGQYLGSYDLPRNLWGQTNVLVGGSVAPGATKSWAFSIHAPATAGTFRFKREMLDPPPSPLGFFQATNLCIDVPIDVTGTAQTAAAVASQTFPTVMAPGETATVSVSMNNTGSQTWPADGSFVLYSRNAPVNLWTTTVVPLRTATPTGSAATLTFNVTAPSAPGTYAQTWGLRILSGASAGVFGEVVNVPVVVSSTTTPGYGATVSSQSFPASMTPGGTYPVSIVMKNSGSKTWQGNTFVLRSMNTPTNLWGTTMVPLPASASVAPNAEYTFAFSVKAPGDVALPSSWRMTQTNGVGVFGQTATTVGGTPHDCTELFHRAPSSPNGIYSIDIDGTGPMAAFDVYCDMTHGGWTQVHDQDVNVSGGFLPKSTWLAGIHTTAPNGGQWGILDRLASFSRTTGDYELRLTYGQDESQFASWVQSGNPLTRSPGTVSAVSMTPPNQTGCGAFSGMVEDEGESALDGNIGGCWWFAVGSQSNFSGGLPAYESPSGTLVTDRIRLYVRR